MIKYEMYPLGLANELQKQQDHLSLYQSRLASLLSQGMKDSKLEEYIRHKIDEITVDINFLETMAAWELLGSVTRSHHSGSVRRTPQASQWGDEAISEVMLIFQE